MLIMLPFNLAKDLTRENDNYSMVFGFIIACIFAVYFVTSTFLLVTLYYCVYFQILGLV